MKSLDKSLIDSIHYHKNKMNKDIVDHLDDSIDNRVWRYLWSDLDFYLVINIENDLKSEVSRCLYLI